MKNDLAGGRPPRLQRAADEIDPASGLWRCAQYRASPNQDARPDPSDVSLLIVHAISLPPGEFGGPWIEKFFTNALDPSAHPYFATIQHLRVSAHVCIYRDGAAVQFVPFHRRAWHAGESRFGARAQCNDFSIGVELEGDDRPFEALQYERLTALTRALMGAYPAITPERIAGHSDVAPGRKSDPGPHFDWARYLQAVEFGR